MTRLMIVLCVPVAAVLAACSPGPEPERPSLAFRTDGAAYVWRVADAPRAALVLAPADGPGTGPAALELTCLDGSEARLRIAALTAEPVPVPIHVTAGAAVLIVTPRRIVTDQAVVLEGEGRLPAGWSEGLAGAAVLKVQYGDQGLELQGPGRALAETWSSRCGTPARRGG